MCCCDAGVLSSSSGFETFGGCGGNPFDDVRQLEHWAPIQPLAADARGDQAKPPDGLWNTDRDTSVADALLRHILLFGEGHAMQFSQRAPRRRVFLDPAEPSLLPLKLSDGGTTAVAAGSSGSESPQKSPSAAAAFSATRTRAAPPASVFAMAQLGQGYAGRSKTLPHGTERPLLFGKSTRRTSAPGFVTAPLRVSELARQVRD